MRQPIAGTMPARAKIGPRASCLDNRGRRNGYWKLVKDDVVDCVKDCEYVHIPTRQTKYISVGEDEPCPHNPN